MASQFQLLTKVIDDLSRRLFLVGPNGIVLVLHRFQLSPFPVGEIGTSGWKDWLITALCRRIRNQ
jgi:hypothetical protein